MALTYPLKDAAARMGVKVAWLQAKVDANEVEYTAIGKRSVGFTDEQISEALKALAVKPRSTPASLTTPRARKRAA